MLERDEQEWDLSVMLGWPTAVAEGHHQSNLSHAPNIHHRFAYEGLHMKHTIIDQIDPTLSSQCNPVFWFEIWLVNMIRKWVWLWIQRTCWTYVLIDRKLFKWDWLFNRWRYIGHTKVSWYSRFDNFFMTRNISNMKEIEMNHHQWSLKIDALLSLESHLKLNITKFFNKSKFCL